MYGRDLTVSMSTLGSTIGISDFTMIQGWEIVLAGGSLYYLFNPIIVVLPPLSFIGMISLGTSPMIPSEFFSSTVLTPSVGLQDQARKRLQYRRIG